MTTEQSEQIPQIDERRLDLSLANISLDISNYQAWTYDK